MRPHMMLHHKRLERALCLLGLMILSACSTVEIPQQTQRNESAQDPTRIQLNQPVHFPAPDGDDVLIPAGPYRIEQNGDTQLKLVSIRDAKLIIIKATTVLAGGELAAPLASVIQDEPDTYEVVLFQPGRPALGAYGSVGNLQARGVNARIPTQFDHQLTALLPDLTGCPGQERLVPGSPPLRTPHRIRNKGAGPAASTTASYGRWSTSPEEYIEYYVVPPLAAGQVIFIVPKRYVVGALLAVDIGNDAKESDETNNTGYVCQ